MSGTMEGVAEHAEDFSQRCPIRDIDFETMEELSNKLPRVKSCGADYIPREYFKDGTVFCRER